MSPPGSIGGGNKMSLAQYNNNIVTIGSALVVPQVDGTVRDSELNTISTSISPTVNIDAIPRSCTTGNGIPVTATNSDKNSDVDSGALNVNNILQDADNVAIAAQTIALPPGTMTGATNVVGSESTMNSTGNPMQGPVAAATSNAAIGNFNSGAKSSNTVFNNPVNMGNVNNLNQYILASSSVPTAALPVVQTPAVPYINNNNYNATPANPFAPAAAAPATDPNALNGNATPANQHFQSAIFQQNAAIMQQNAATLQHLQNLHQTNKLMAANPEAASTLGMLAPVMNMNLAATANPVQLLATATPSLNMNPANASAGTSLPPAKASQAPSDFNGAFATAPVGTQPQQQQGMLIPVPLGTMTIASRASQTFPAAGFPNNSGNNRTTDGSNNNDAVQNILRTAFMLQNSGLPFLQQGMISQQHQRQLMPVPAASGGLVMVPNATNANSTLLGIAPATISAQTSDAHGSENSGKKVDVGKNGNGLTSGAAAAANAAASVLPPASMNLPLQQQLQQQQQQQQQLQQQRLQFQQYHPVQQMGIDLNSNNNNTIALLGGAALNNNDGIQVPGLATLQQQQYNKAMVFPPMNLSDPHSQLPLPLVLPQQQQKQQLSNPAAVKLNQQVPQSQKKQTSISRPLYLDHDSNCLTAYQCFLRKQIELFEVGHDEMTGTAQGRNTPLQYGQVGIRCRHCAHLPKVSRARGGVYYSRTIGGVYQVAQNMSKLHFLKACTQIPDNTKNQLKSLQSVSSRASGGKEYWAEGMRVLGIVEDKGILRFAFNSTSQSATQKSDKSTE